MDKHFTTGIVFSLEETLNKVWLLDLELKLNIGQ